MRLCVLQADYSGTPHDYADFDPARDLSSLWPEARIDHVFLRKNTVYKQLEQASRQKYNAYVNLCEGYLHWEVPSIDVPLFLERLNLPYTGPTPDLYDPSKEIMKLVAFNAGVAYPPYSIFRHGDAINLPELTYPLFVKPAHAGDSLGIDESSLVDNYTAMKAKVSQITEEFGTAMVEEYIAGREFTVLVMANPDRDDTPITYRALEFVFPKEYSFKSYDLKVTQHHPSSNKLCDDTNLDTRLREAASAIFRGFSGKGYARLDFRVNNKGEIFFLEINFTCSVFYPPGYEGSADYILNHSAGGQSAFLKHIVQEGIARHAQKQKKYIVKGNASAGYGIFANKNLISGEVIFPGEALPQSLVTRNYVDKHWSKEQQDVFKRYAYPISSEVFILWSDKPEDWAPQNHSCNPNTAFDGLNLVAQREIPHGEELTLDYATFCDESMQSFECQCKSQNCRGRIYGTPGNSVTFREKNKIQ